jgi:phage antirepressor YoqD-like protein
MKKNSTVITFSIAEVAKITNFPGGEHKFFEWLRANGYLLINNQPSEFQIQRGWFVLVSKEYGPNNEYRSIPVSRVSLKGLAGLERVIDKAFPICPICPKCKEPKD